MLESIDKKKKNILEKKGPFRPKRPFMMVKKQKIEKKSVKSYSLSKYLSFDMLECIDKKKIILVKKRAIFATSFLAKKGSKSLIFLLFRS